MKKVLTVSFILLSNTLFAQSTRQPTQFDKFVSRASIEWAAYVNNQAKFEKEQLNRLLLERLAKKEIKAALPLYSGINDLNNITYSDKEAIDNVLHYPVLDSLSLTDITQVLYIEKGQLKSYVLWVSPMIQIKTSFGVSLGYGDYFSTCFNFKYNYKPRKKNKSLFLSETKQIFSPDSTGAGNKLKELYGRNLIETLWPYILNVEVDVFSFETNTHLKKEEINEYLARRTSIPTPVYDTGGVVTGFQLPSVSDFDPKKIIKIELLQDWYYDHKKNIVYNKIKELYLYALLPVSEEEQEKSAPVLKIVFN